MPTRIAAIRIGICLSRTGPLADNSRSAQPAHEIWRQNINTQGGLLGRSVEFVCYDVRADASLVPGIYKRLMDDDQVDLVISGYGTNSLLPAMPLIMPRERFFVGLMGLGVNNALSYPNYFAMIRRGRNRTRPMPRNCTCRMRGRVHSPFLPNFTSPIGGAANRCFRAKYVRNSNHRRTHYYDYWLYQDHRRSRHLLQGLGPEECSAYRVSSRLAALVR